MTDADTPAFNPEYYGLPRLEMHAFLPPSPRRVLEVGCGAGRFGGKIKQDTPTVEIWGIEPMTAAANVAAKTYDKVLIGFFDDVRGQLPEGYFDLIICNDVIEHMEQHEAFMAAIGAYLSADGVLVGSIPNVRYYKNMMGLLFRREWEYTDDSTLDRTHLRFFTERSLKNLFHRHGYDIEAFKGINNEFHKGWLYSSTLTALFLIGVTFGAWRDIADMQYAFRIRQRKSTAVNQINT